MVSILIAAAANSLRVRNAARRLQQWWLDELWKKKEKEAALVIERFFVHVKKEVEQEVKALKKKKKDRRRRRKLKQSDDYILERAWLGVAEESAAPVLPAAVPQRTAAPRYPPANNNVGMKDYNNNARGKGMIQSVDDDAQSDVSGLTDLDFGHRNTGNRNRSKKSQKAFGDDASLEEAFRDSEAQMRSGGSEQHNKRQHATRHARRTQGYPRRY